MLFKKVLSIALLFMLSIAVTAQQTNQKEIKLSAKDSATRFVLPDGNVSDPVALKKESTGSSFSKTMSSIGSSIRQTIGVALETFMPFQFKYALMLNEKVENLTNVALYKTIDDWYGTRYRYGGTTPKGIDCSAFMQVLGTYAFGWALPRTAREQYAQTQSISKDDLKEGDLVFFNTTGGISHVGMYLQNNQFIHSSSSQGVVISNLSDKYWQARFIGARRSQEDAPKNSDQVF